jgi:very-short-patch-repair endonuclease
VITVNQLNECGLGERAIRWRADVGRLHRIHRGVYAVGAAPLTQQGRWMAAVLACGDGAVLSHYAAGALWRILPAATRIDVTVPTRAGRGKRKGIAVHRSPLERYEVTRRERISVTTPARTLLDLAAILPRRRLERATDEAEYLRLFDRRAIRRVVVAHPAHPGAAKLRRLLSEHTAGATRTRTGLEEDFLALCRAEGLPTPEVNVQVGPFEADFLWRDHRLIVETDGRAAHGTRRSFEHDRARDARLTTAGYRVVRFTYRQVVREPEAVARVLASLLERRSTLRS